MGEVTRAQDQLAEHLALRYGRSHTMRLGDGAVIVFGMTASTTVVRLHVSPDGTAQPASRQQLDRAWRRALAHVRSPCPSCNYPARAPRCARCGTKVGYVAANAQAAA